MLSLLTPLALWLAPLVAAPLVIHLLGRARAKPRDFPSLLAVRGRLERAMQRHRLKNWLLLVLRTLVLLCLLLAAADPVWRPRDGFAPPAAAGLLLHNGAYGAIPRDGGGTFLDSQRDLLRALDSLAAGGGFTEPLLPDAGGSSAVPRFGGGAEAVARLLRRAEAPTSRATHVFVPVFDPRDLEPHGLAARVRSWLEAHPRARLVLFDHAGLRDRLTPFGAPAFDFSREGVARLRIPVSADTAPLWIPRSGAARETRLRDGIAEITLPLPSNGWLAGAFALPEGAPDRHAWKTRAVSLRIPPPAVLCHLGPPGSFASLATLGAGGPRLRVLPMITAAEIDRHACDLLYLADPPELDAGVLARAAAVARTGGRVILGAGRNTDPALWNRHLLVPLGIGRLEAAERHSATAIRPRPRALAALGWRAGDWGGPGTVRARMGFRPGDSGTTVLLSAGSGGTESPLLLHRKVGQGSLLLWLTDIGDPEWSDLALGPWPALLHQAYVADAWAGGIEVRAAHSDSAIFLQAPAPEGESPRVSAPDGTPFTRAEREPGGVRLGPFDVLGNHAIVRGGDTAWLAVHLQAREAPATDADRDEEAWTEFMEALGPEASRRTARVAGNDDWRALYGGMRLRLALLLAAALLLFAEGVVSLRLSAFRNTVNT